MDQNLKRLAQGAGLDEILDALHRDGAVIVENALTETRVRAVMADLEPFIRDTAPFPDDFSGHQTTRTGGLVARSQVVRELIMEPSVLGAARRFLEPFTDKIQLNLTQIIRLLPGQGAQVLHRDRFIWGKYLPREIEPQLNTIWALTDFTAENGATRVVPGSHRWDWERQPEADEVAQAVMPRGSVMYYTGSVIHSGGENRSGADRIALNLTFANAWLRQEENQYMSCPPDIARQFPPELRALLGYTMANYALGYYAPPVFVPGTPGTVPPEVAFENSVDTNVDADVPPVRTF